MGEKGPNSEEKSVIDLTKEHFLKSFEEGTPIYPYFPRHVAEVERWTKRLLESHPKADGETVLLSVWLHDIGNTFGDLSEDHAVKSEIETRCFLPQIGIDEETVDAVAHCVRAHRCRDVQPATLEAEILAAADSASHMTDFNFIVHAQDGLLDYAKEKLERDFRDIGLFPELQEQLRPLYEAWKMLLEAYPEYTEVRT